MNEQQRKKIRRAILAHEEYKAKWVKDDRCFFSVTWISPRGKEMTYSGYCAAINKHPDETADKIEKILKP